MSDELFDFHNILNSKIETAIEELGTFIKNNPDNADAHYYLGLVYHKNGEIEKSICLLEKALQIDDKHLGVLLSFSEILSQKGEIESAIKNLEKAYKINNKNRYVLYYLGKTHNKIENYDTAIEYLEKAINIFPDDKEIIDELVISLNEKAIHFFEEQNYHQTHQILEKSLNINNSVSRTHSILADTYKVEGDMQKAYEEYYTAYNLDSTNAYNILNMGDILFHNQDFDNAEIALKEAINLDEGFLEAYIGLAELYILKEDFVNAEKILLKANSNIRENSYIHSYLGVVYLHKHSLDKVINYSEKAYQLDNNNIITLLNLILAYFDKFDTENTEKYISELSNKYITLSIDRLKLYYKDSFTKLNFILEKNNLLSILY